MAKASGSGFDPGDNKDFFHFFHFLFSRPLQVRTFQSSLYEGSELDNLQVVWFLKQEVLTRVPILNMTSHKPHPIQKNYQPE